MSEIWKSIPGYGGFYEASNTGKIRVKDRKIRKNHKCGKIIEQLYKGRILKTSLSKKGYYRVNLGINKTNYTVSVHKLILLAFIGHSKEGQEACHNDGNSENNNINNLRWDTHASNNADRKAHGTYPIGTDHPMAKFTNEQISKIRDGEISRDEAMANYGISYTHFYRIKNGDTGHA